MVRRQDSVVVDNHGFLLLKVSSFVSAMVEMVMSES